jgi:hypothetical protein
MSPGPDRRGAIFRGLQVVLIVGAFGYAFAHGIAIGQYKIGFQPIWRIRQTVAVAISRMREPPLHGYLAYQAIVVALNRNGFAVFPGDEGPHFEADNWIPLFYDTARLERALGDAQKIAIDPASPPQLIQANELAYADYVYLSFRVFGLHFSSLYYLYFLLLGVSCVLFIIEFHRSPFLMFALSLQLAGIGFLENYACAYGVELASVANSRLFEALSIVPAIHIFALLWRRLPPRWPTVAIAAIQSGLLAFLIDCRVTARWQMGMIVATALGMLLIAIVPRRSGAVWPRTKRLWNGIWAGGLALAVLLLHMTAVSYMADDRYRLETEYHAVWHEVLRGLLGSSTELQLAYLGEDIGLGPPADTVAYEAVNQDLNRRHDHSSSIAVVENGKISIDVGLGWGEYERLARRLVFRIIVHHPGAVVRELYAKLAEQVREYFLHDAMAPPNLASASLVALLAGLLWLGAGGAESSIGDLLDGTVATLVVLACALTPPLIVPSVLSVGTLLSYMAALVIAVILVAAAAARGIMTAVMSRRTPSPASIGGKR